MKEEKVEETVKEESEEPEPEPEPEREPEEEEKAEKEEEEEESEEEKCECYSVDPPKHPWRSTFAFGTHQCRLCGRRVKK